jgi:HAD superfamily hydrolase (TIGR01509 family)
LVIFDCNGVLVDSEPIATAVLVEEFARVGVSMTREMVAHKFLWRRPADIYAAVEAATGRRLPVTFSLIVADKTRDRLAAELRPTPHITHALNWVRGPKAVASSSSFERMCASLETTDLLRYFEPRLFSASEVARGKPAPDLFEYTATKLEVDPADCIVIEDSPPGVAAAVAAGMKPIGFVGGSHASFHLASQLTAAGARTVIADMRALHSAVIELRGW